MAYNERARALRRCTGTRADGETCRAWAVWDDPRQLCMAHAGWHHRGPMPEREWGLRRPRKRVPNCTCRAYAWPHRPGDGLCNWPDPPEYICTIPAGTHRWW